MRLERIEMIRSKIKKEGREYDKGNGQDLFDDDQIKTDEEPISNNDSMNQTS